MHRTRRAVTQSNSDSDGDGSNRALHADHVEQRRVNALAAAYEEERRQRDQLEKKYARLKRRYIRLERAHAKMLMESHGMSNSSESLNRSPLPSRATYTTSPLDTREERRSPETSDHRVMSRISLSMSNDSARGESRFSTRPVALRTQERSLRNSVEDVIDLTSPSTRSSLGRTQDSSPISFYLATRHSRSTTSAARSLSDDFCAESPDSARGEEVEDRLSRRSAGRVAEASAFTRRPLSLVHETRRMSPLHNAHGSEDDEVVITASSRPTLSARSSPTSATSMPRPRPRLGVVDSPDRRIRRGPEQDRDYTLGRRRTTTTTSASSVSPTYSVPSSSSAASSPTTINSSPRSSPGPDSAEAASIALAQYLQQQENIAAYEEYEARLHEAARQQQEDEASNQYEYLQASAAQQALLQHHDIDPDNMTYDELLQLGEQNGDVKKERWREMAVHVISQLPTHRWSGNQDSDVSVRRWVDTRKQQLSTVKKQGVNMGQGQSGLPRQSREDAAKKKEDAAKKKKKFEPRGGGPTRRRRKKKGPSVAVRIPPVYPTAKCKLRLLKLERIKDFLLMEQEFIQNQEVMKPKHEKDEEERSKVDDLRGTPMGVGTLEEMIDDNHAIVSSSSGPEYYVGVMSFVNQDMLEPGCSVLLHNKVMSVVGILADDTDPMVSVMKVDKAPLESYADIGGLESQIQEIKEAVELPLTHPELYEGIGIRPPKGVILYGEPGTGKTLLAKAVANQTSATFLRVVGSELIQKYLGDGPKLVREMFRVADDHAPSIVFIDEIDAVGSKRYDSSSGGTREIQRTMLELLNQLDGFDERGDVKVIMATNAIESLDPALIRPGRIDRKIEFPLPDIKTKRRIFNIHTGRMSLSEDVDLEEFVMAKDELSGADIKAVCTEAGLLALRERRMRVTQADFRKAKEKALYRKKANIPEGLYL
ncbi:26s protease regulatory subunit 4, partial [Globisporangium splendens]